VESQFALFAARATMFYMPGRQWQRRLPQPRLISRNVLQDELNAKSINDQKGLLKGGERELKI
jgi:hypothetical protein